MFLDLIDLASGGRGAGVWRGAPAPETSGRTYGGQFLAQGLAAAYQTVEPGRRVHSLHAYFVAGGDVTQPTDYTVNTVRDGRSFSLRSVSGSQGDREVFMMSASFQVPEPGLTYQPDLSLRLASGASVPNPADTELDYNQFGYLHPDLDPDGDWSGDLRPMEIRYINPPPQPSESAGGPLPATNEPQLTWQRMRSGMPAGTVDEETWMPDDPAVHDCAVAYLSDSTLIDHILLPHGFRWQDARLTGTSLDHAMWFYGDRTARADQWLLCRQSVEATGSSRGLATGRIYSASGELVASCQQEGLMRWRFD